MPHQEQRAGAGPRRVGLHPRRRTRAILQERRICHGRIKAVIRNHDDGAGAGQGGRHERVHRLAAAVPGAAIEEHHDRQARGVTLCIYWPVYIQGFARQAAIGHVALDGQAAGRHGGIQQRGGRAGGQTQQHGGHRGSATLRHGFHAVFFAFAGWVKIGIRQGSPGIRPSQADGCSTAGSTFANDHAPTRMTSSVRGRARPAHGRARYPRWRTGR